VGLAVYPGSTPALLLDGSYAVAPPPPVPSMYAAHGACAWGRRGVTTVATWMVCLGAGSPLEQHVQRARGESPLYTAAASNGAVDMLGQLLS
jgi:hypothetical protein